MALALSLSITSLSIPSSPAPTSKAALQRFSTVPDQADPDEVVEETKRFSEIQSDARGEGEGEGRIARVDSAAKRRDERWSTTDESEGVTVARVEGRRESRRRIEEARWRVRM